MSPSLRKLDGSSVGKFRESPSSEGENTAGWNPWMLPVTWLKP